MILLNRMEKFKQKISDEDSPDYDYMSTIVLQHIGKIINLIKIFMNIKITVLFDAKSLIFKEFDNLINDIHDNISKDTTGNNDYK